MILHFITILCYFHFAIPGHQIGYFSLHLIDDVGKFSTIKLFFLKLMMDM